MGTLAKDLNVTDASRLATNLRLAGVHFSGVKAKVIAGGELTGDLTWKLLPINIVWGVFDKQVRVIVPVSLHVLREKNAEPIAEIGVLLRLDYEVLKDGNADAAIDSFAGISGCMHAWPYVRAEVQHLSTKLELPPLLLPPVVSGNIPSIVGTVERVQAQTGAASGGAQLPRPRAQKTRKARKARKGA